MALPIFSVVLALLAVGAAVSPGGIGRFSSGTPGSLPSGWRVHTFHHIKPTRYSLVLDQDRVALQADSHDSASALITETDVDLARTPWIEWSWRIDHVIPNAPWGRKSTDDFPARLFVIFADARLDSLTQRVRDGFEFGSAASWLQRKVKSFARRSITRWRIRLS